ncbi:contractile injection system tape measure protein [Maribacter sp. 2307UL18-2]|uniref:contractile injection system tape measure protein n=1 Tax=Maribacter sp. 2307UL18-2 TaxID=3386274 RepID=UPI0039BC7EFC
MNEQIHIIGQQHIHIKVNGWHNIDAITDSVLEDISFSFNTLADDFFDYLPYTDIDLKIDDLILDLGEVSEEELGGQFREKVLSSLKTNLEEQIETGGLKSEISIRKENADETLVQTWNYFIRHGYFPWWSAIRAVDDLEDSILSVLPSGRVNIESFSRTLKQDIGFYHRFRHQFSAEFVSHVLETTPKPDKTIKALMRNMQLLETDSALATGLLPDVRKAELHKLQFAVFSSSHIESAFAKERKIWKKFFISLFKEMSKIGSSDFKTWLFNEPKIWEPIVRLDPEMANHLKKVKKDIAIQGNVHKYRDDTKVIGTETAKTGEGHRRTENAKREPEEANKREIHDFEKKKFFRTDGNEKIMRSDVPKSVNGNPISTKSAYDGTTGSIGLSKYDFSKFDREAEQEIFVSNAGLAILHPYLSPLFIALNFIQKGKFVERRLANSAINLLGYIATGEIQPPEEELILAKVLCGMPTDSPIERRLVLKKKERAEADKMLRTVISYWSALGNTSIETFQDSFLKREGKLSLRNNRWDLLVEQKTIDVLMNKIPWGISPIKLPWMNKLLFVTWV